MIGCLRTRVRKQPIIALYFEFETIVKFYNLGARYPYPYLDDKCKLFCMYLAIAGVNIRSHMSAHVLLNLLNELKPCILSLFVNSFNKFNNT